MPPYDLSRKLSVPLVLHVLMAWLLWAALDATLYMAASDSPNPVMVSTGASRPIPRDFLGISSETVNPAENTQMLEAFRATGAAHLRYPGGGVANYWDWSLGWIRQDLDENRLLSWMYGMQASPERFTLESLAETHQQTGAGIVFVLNVVTDSADSQIDHLRHAQRLGIPIERVELGNELYMDIEPYVMERYPLVEDYAHEANQWAAALKAAFPDVQVAVVGASRSHAPPNSRTGTWNRLLFPLLSADIDAVAEHIYTDSGVGPRVAPNGTGWGSSAEQQAQHTALHTEAGIAQFLSRPFRAWADFQLFSQLAQDHDIWMTEFNLFDWNGPARGTWAHGLITGGFIHNFLTHEGVSLATYHSLSGGPLFPAVFPHDHLWAGLMTADIRTPAYELTASGVALSLFTQAMNGMDTADELVFTPNPLNQVPLSVSYPSLWGWRFSGSDSAALLLVNYSAEIIEADLTMLVDTLATSASFTQVYAAPADYVLGTDSLAWQTGASAQRLNLPAYSITVIGG